jgi:futalosine hydrolase
MRLLVIAATEAEIAGWRNSKMPGDILITGVGVTSSLYRISRALASEKYDLAIQAGVAGSFHEGLRPGEVVAVTSDVFADEGIWETGIFTPLAASSLATPDSYPLQNGRLVNLNMPELSGDIKKVRAVTVSMISDDKIQKARLQDIFSADIESMEGASLHFAALMEKTAFLQLRAVSNFVGDRNKENWRLAEAISNLNEVLIGFCKSL